MKFLKLSLFLAGLFFACQSAFSQPICAFDNFHGKLLKTDSGYRKTILFNETRIKEYIRKHPLNSFNTLRESASAAVLYSIPVAVHVVHTGGAVGTVYNPTDAQIQGAINYLNQVYNGTYPGIEGVGDLQVQFVLASRDTNCNSFSGIDRIDGSSLTNYATNGVNSSTSGGISDLALKNFDRWDPSSYYNIWVVNKIDGKDGTSGQFVAGYAYFAGAPATVDGTVMLATQMATGKKTLPHEIGHALSLYHPFEGSSDAATCPANSNCNADGDEVCDTDPITYNQTAGVVDFTCRSGVNTCTGTAYSSNTEKNYMNYTSCYTLFTAGQKARMLAAMSLPSRQSLANSRAIGTYPLSPYTNPLSASCAPASSATGIGNYYAGIMSVSVANRTFNSGTTKDDAGYLDNTTKCLNLVELQKNNTYNFSITVFGQNYEQLRMWIDYNNDGAFDNTTEQIYYSPSITPLAVGSGYTTVSGSFTVPGTALSNAVLRMRVTDELSTDYDPSWAIANACYSPIYGQAEDYPVFLSALLPVQYDYFNGAKKAGDVLLSWKTSTEANAQEFQVEKSTDGIAFNRIGTVAANNTKASSYSFTDKNVTGTENYYRLRQVDKDQKAALSQAILIKSAGEGGTTVKVLNDPFNNQFAMVFNGVTTGNSAISLFDMTGRKVFSKIIKITNGQPISIDVSGAGLKPGMYILQAQTGTQITTKKLIKQ
ncbi:MAG: zinc-dependent metalloprotease [Bacteroidota bacterium]